MQPQNLDILVIADVIFENRHFVGINHQGQILTFAAEVGSGGTI